MYVFLDVFSFFVRLLIYILDEIIFIIGMRVSCFMFAGSYFACGCDTKIHMISEPEELASSGSFSRDQLWPDIGGTLEPAFDLNDLLGPYGEDGVIDMNTNETLKRMSEVKNRVIARKSLQAMG
jgi:hypothetical protein